MPRDMGSCRDCRVSGFQVQGRGLQVFFFFLFRFFPQIAVCRYYLRVDKGALF